MHETERRHVGQMEQPFPEARPVGGSRRAELRDVSERIGAEIAESLCVRRIADAEGIEDEKERTRHETP